MLLFSSLQILSFGLLLVASEANNIPTSSSSLGSRCVDYTIPITVSSDSFKWTGPKWNDDFGLADFITSAVTRPEAGFPPAFGNLTRTTDLYQITGTFCTPEIASVKARPLLLATHGIGFDRRHWNSAYKPEKYSFVQAATKAGYSIFFYDRLGTWNSTKISGFVNQINIQVPILAALAKDLRTGKYTGNTGAPSSIILIGHSFGSFISNALVAAQPSIVDAIIMTGYSLGGGNSNLVAEAFAPRIAATQDREKFGRLDTGYVTTADVYSTVNEFFKAPDYEHGAVIFVEDTKQAFAIAELFSLDSVILPSLNASSFAGPALVISGEYDFILCGGYCPGVIQDPLTAYFAGSKDFEISILPGTGHVLNFALNAPAAYSEIFAFLGKNGF